MLAGAQLFKKESFDAALVEFEVAERLGAKDAAWYRAASLVQLHRPEAAIEAFSEARALAPGNADALLEYYQALAFYQAKLYLGADALLAGLKDRAGPRIASQAEKIRKDLSAVLTAETTREAIDWYLERARAASARAKQVLAGAYLSEAALLARRRPDAYRRAEAEEALQKRLAPAVPRPPVKR